MRFPLIILVAWLFCRFVEEPSARLARVAGERVPLRGRKLSQRSAIEEPLGPGPAEAS